MLHVRITLKKSCHIGGGKYKFFHHNGNQEVLLKKVEYECKTWQEAVDSFDFDEVKEVSITDLSEEE